MQKATRHLFAVAALASLLASGPTAAAPGAMDFLFSGGMAPASERVVGGLQRVWKLGEFSALRLSAKADGSGPNAHPATLDAAALQMALLGLQFEATPGVWKPLLVAADLQDLSQALARALALATPQDDVLLMASARYDGALLGLQRSVLARLFVRQGALHILVQEARADVLASYRAAHILPAYDFGSRQTASASKIRAAGATSLRPDWLALDLAPAPAAALAPGAAVAPAPLAAPVAMPPAPPPAPGLRDKAFFEQQAQRLEGLKSLYDKGLISDAEYLQKRAEILQTL